MYGYFGVLQCSGQILFGKTVDFFILFRFHRKRSRAYCRAVKKVYGYILNNNFDSPAANTRDRYTPQKPEVPATIRLAVIFRSLRI